MAVYFVQAGQGGPIKIGYTENLRLRLQALSAGVPHEIIPLGVDDGALAGDEIDIHIRFAKCRLRGEWFNPTPELLAYISENSDPIPRKPRRSGRRTLSSALLSAYIENRVLDELISISDKKNEPFENTVERAIREFCDRERDAPNRPLP